MLYFGCWYVGQPARPCWVTGKTSTRVKCNTDLLWFKQNVFLATFSYSCSIVNCKFWNKQTDISQGLPTFFVFLTMKVTFYSLMFFDYFDYFIHCFEAIRQHHFEACKQLTVRASQAKVQPPYSGVSFNTVLQQRFPK